MEISRELNEPLLGEEPYRYEAKKDFWGNVLLILTLL